MGSIQSSASATTEMENVMQAASEREMNDHIKALMIDRLNLRMSSDEIPTAVPIFSTEDGGLGLDSIDALDLAVALFEEFQLEVEQKDMHIFKSVETISAFVLERSSNDLVQAIPA
jgi:acyl carrier protein